MKPSLPLLALLCSSTPLLLIGCGGGSETPQPAAVASTAESQQSVHSLGGSVSGLHAAGLILSNGTDTLGVPAGSGSFTMSRSLANGATYALTVQAQPAGQTCSVANGSGTMGQADIANAVVTCSTHAHQLGGSINGLLSAGLVVANGSDTVSVDSGATTFALPANVAEGSGYAVTIQNQPTGENCAVSGGTGTMAESDVSDVTITCSAQAHGLGGSIVGLGAAGLVLANGSDTLVVASGATTFLMPTVHYGVPYAVTVQTQPAGLTCSVVNGSGTMGAADVSNVAVTCAVNSHMVSGTLSGLTSSGLVIANGADVLAVSSNATSFNLPTPVAEGSSYSVAVQTQPPGLTCSIGNGTGTMGASNVSNVAVTCSPTAYTLGGTISGLTVSGLVLSNGSDTLSVAANATSFSMPTPVTPGTAYAVLAQSQPPYKQCTVTNGVGTMPGSAVSNVDVTCISIAQVSTVAGTAGVNGSTDGTGAAASFYRPFGIAVNSAGDYFVGDINNNEIRRVTPAGVVTTFAGSTTHGFTDGTGTAAAFYGPSGIAIDANDNLYVVDRLNYSIRKISPAGVVTTLAGSGSYGSANGTGSAASFGSIYGLAVDSQGNVYVGDQSNNQIRKITPAGVVTTFAGTGSPGAADGAAASATFYSPAGMAVGANDDVYVADTGNHKIRKITQAGVVTTIAGSGSSGSADGTGAAASFSSPYGLTVDASGLIYVADTLGNKLRKVTQAGVVTTLAGTSSSGHTDGAGSVARFYLPTGVALDANGNLVVADYNNNIIRKVTP